MSGIIQISDKRFTIEVSTKKYTINVSTGGVVKRKEVWFWGNTIDVDVAVSPVTNSQLSGITLSPIIYLNSTPVNWAKAGIVHDISAGTLDFTDYIADSEFKGYIDFQYKG